MTDMIAGQDVTCSNWHLSEVDNLRPTDQEKDPSNQPAAEMREHSLRNVLSEHVSEDLPAHYRSSEDWFTKITCEPHVPIGIDSSGLNPKYLFHSARA